MKSFFRTGMAAVWLIALVLALTPGCSKEEDPSKTGEKAQDSVDVSGTIALAEKNMEKLRLNLVATRDTKIEILGARPGPIPGLVELKMRASREGRTAIRRVMVSSDFAYVVQGIVVPVGKVPRQRVEMENVDLKGAPVRGNPDAPVTIVEYSDFQCPFCSASQPALERIMKEYEGKVKLVFKHYPLEMHPWALDAAIISECARMQKPDVFWKLHDHLFARPAQITTENILEETIKLLGPDGIDAERLTKCHLEQETAPAIHKDLDEGQVIGVVGTPVFLINDVFLSGNTQFEILDAIVKEEMGHDWLQDWQTKESEAEADESAAEADESEAEADESAAEADESAAEPDENVGKDQPVSEPGEGA